MTAAVDDELWSAVGDPTRRRMLDLLLVDGTGTATSLSEQLPVTRQAVAKHLAVLDRDPFDRSLGSIGQTTNELTMVSGRVVFERS